MKRKVSVNTVWRNIMTQLNRPIKNFEEFQDSLNDFTKFYPRLMGMTDIDGCYEHHRKFLFYEQKTVINGRIQLPMGQFILLVNLQEKLGNDSYVLLIGVIKGITKKYIICNIDDFAHYSTPEEVNGVKMRVLNVEKEILYNEPEIIDRISKIAEAF